MAMRVPVRPQPALQCTPRYAVLDVVMRGFVCGVYLLFISLIISTIESIFSGMP